MIVLTVDIGQAAAEFGQQRNGYDLAVDPAYTLTRLTDFSLNDSFLVRCDPVFFKEGLGLFIGGIQRQLDDCLIFTGTHISGVGTASESRGDRLDNDGLPGTGFPGDHIAPLMKIHVQVIDDGKILDLDVCNHSFT